MSEFIAQAQVLVRPDTSKFRAELQAQLLVATKGVVVPVTVVPSKTGAVASGFSALTAAQNGVKKSTADVNGALETLNGKATKTTSALLGAGSATAKLDSALLGLRTALGSTAVIGLGATALAAIAVGKAIRASLLDFSAFEQELATFRATAGATAEQMKAVTDEAVRLGADIRLPAVSAVDAAIAITELSKAGLSVQDAMAGAEGVLELATAAQISNAEAAVLAANALNSFGLAGDQAARVADDLANAANASQGSITDIGIAMRQVSAVARQVGLSLEDTTAILALFAKNGLSGSDAGTSLRVALIRLTAPTKAAAAEIQRLGLQVRDAQGNFRPDVFAQFGEATRDLTPAARDAAAALIFGQDAIRAVSIGAREGAVNLELMQFAIDQQGTAAELAAARTEGLAGAFSALQSNAQNLGITLGRALSGPVADTAKNFAIIFGVIDQGIQKLGELNSAVPTGSDGFFGRLSDDINAFGKTFATPGAALVNTLKQFGLLGSGSTDLEERLGRLRVQIEGLQSARALVPPEQIELARSLTLQIERLKKQIADTKREIAGFPAGNQFSKVTDSLRATLDNLQKVRDFRLSQGIVKDTDFLNQRIQSLKISIAAYERAAKLGLGTTESLRGGFINVDNAARSAAGGVDALAAAITALTHKSAVLGDELLKLQSEGGTPAQQIGVLQSDVQVQRDLIESLRGGPGGIVAGEPSQIRAAREKIIADQNEIKSLQAGIVSDQKKAADDAKKLADEAQEQRDKQFQALADTFGRRQAGIEDKISRAGIAENVQKQINLTKALIASFQKELAALKERASKLKISNDARKRIQAAILTAIREARLDILRFEKEQAENVKDFATPAIDLRIRIAQARDNVKQEIALRRQRLAAITKELVRLKNAGKKNTIAWLELKAQQAEEAAAIKELEGKTKDKNTAQQSFFKFLQTQQGFAANLLGNLIPGFATKGLVGGSTPAPGQPMLAGPEDRARATADVGATRAAGVRPVQVDTTNALLRQILAALNGRHTQPPEIRHNRATGNAVADTL